MANLANAWQLLESRVARAETIVANVETLWQLAPPNSDVRKQIGDSELAALYEMSFLTTFGYWENFIEECLVRMLAGQGSGTYDPPVLVSPPRSTTLDHARTRLLDGRPYLLWHDVAKCISKTQAFVVNSPLENALLAAETDLGHFAAVRHAIAHRSKQTTDNFRKASTAISGVAHTSPGELLRALDHSDALNPVRWIRVISNRIREVALAATS